MDGWHGHGDMMLLYISLIVPDWPKALTDVCMHMHRMNEGRGTYVQYIHVETVST